MRSNTAPRVDGWFREVPRRFARWLRSFTTPSDPGSDIFGRVLERPWRMNWRSSHAVGPRFGAPDVARARARGAEVARCTLGDEAWEMLWMRGYLEVRSHRFPGLTYRLRIGRRVQLVWDTAEYARRSPWPHDDYLCINPTYPLPAVEFVAQLYLYLRDREDHVIRIAVPQQADHAISYVF